MKKSLLLVSAIMMAAIGGLASCSESTASNESELAVAGNQTVLNANQALAFESASALDMIQISASASSLKERHHHTSSGETSSSSLTSEENATAEAATLADITSYLPTIDFAYANSQVLNATYAQTSDKEGYAYVSSLSYLDQDGTYKTASIYYNIVVEDTSEDTSSEAASETSSETGTSEATGTSQTEQNPLQTGATAKSRKHGEGYESKFGDGKDEGDHEKVKIVKQDINGIVLIDGVSYEMAGRTGTNSDGVELTSFGFYYTDTSYIKVRQEVINDRVMFKYSAITDGKVVSSYEIGMFTKDERVHIYFRTKDIDEKNFTRFTFYTENGLNYLIAKVKKTGYPDYVFNFQVVTAEDGTVSFTYLPAASPDSSSETSSEASSQETASSDSAAA